MVLPDGRKPGRFRPESLTGFGWCSVRESETERCREDYSIYLASFRPGGDSNGGIGVGYFQK